MKTYQNQKVITVKKAEQSKGYFSMQNVSANQTAWKKLSHNAYKVYAYFNMNQDAYSFALSGAEVRNALNIKQDSTYIKAVNELIENSYLLEFDKEKRHFFFLENNEEPELDIKYSQAELKDKLVFNQKQITIVKTASDKNHLYATLNVEANKTAIQELSATTYKVYIYMAMNMNDFTFGLSSKDVTEKLNISIGVYNKAVAQLIEAGYLVQTAPNKYIFRESKDIEISVDEINADSDTNKEVTKSNDNVSTDISPKTVKKDKNDESLESEIADLKITVKRQEERIQKQEDEIADLKRQLNELKEFVFSSLTQTVPEKTESLEELEVSAAPAEEETLVESLTESEEELLEEPAVETESEEESKYKNFSLNEFLSKKEKTYTERKTDDFETNLRNARLAIYEDDMKIQREKERAEKMKRQEEKEAEQIKKLLGITTYKKEETESESEIEEESEIESETAVDDEFDVYNLSEQDYLLSLLD